MRTLALPIALALSLSSLPALAETPPDRAAQLQDLEAARTDYLPKEMAYTPQTRALAQARLQAMEAQAGKLTAAQMLVGLAQVGALTDNAHSGIRYHDPKAAPPARLPLRLLWFPDGLIVARATGAAADLAGARVLRIEGRTPEALYERIKGLQGGKAVDRRKYLPEFIESVGLMQAMGVARSPDHLAFTLRLGDGRTVTRQIAMTPKSDVSPTAAVERLWAPDPVAKEAGWRPALAMGHTPLYLQDPDQPFRLVDLPHALYIQFRTNEDADGHPIAAFQDEVRARLKATPPANIVLDLRFDVGGNLLTTLAFMHDLPAATPGRVFLLVGPYTYSAGIISAAAVKKAGGDRVTIIGDEPGDRPHFWSEGGLTRLPNSGLGLRYTNGQFDLEHGCAGQPGCMDKMVDVNFVSLTPDIPAPLTAQAWLAGRDPALEAVTAALVRPSR